MLILRRNITLRDITDAAALRRRASEVVLSSLGTNGGGISVVVDRFVFPVNLPHSTHCTPTTQHDSHFLARKRGRDIHGAVLPAQGLYRDCREQRLSAVACRGQADEVDAGLPEA